MTGPFQIDVGIDDRDAEALLARLARRARNTKAAMSDVGELVRNSVVRNFEEGGRPASWKPLAASTVLGRISRKDFTRSGRLRAQAGRRLRGGTPLSDSGTLRNSVSVRATNEKAEIGPKGSIPYAAIHQLGGTAGRGRQVEIPARPYLLVQDRDWPDIRKVLVRHLMEGP